MGEHATTRDDPAGGEADRDPLTDPEALRFVGPATAAVIADAPFDAGDIARRRVSYEMLREAGANPGVAARIRREHSLPWSFASTPGEALRRRSDQVRHLRDDERAWIAASVAEPPSEDASTDGGGTAEQAEQAWRNRG